MTISDNFYCLNSTLSSSFKTNHLYYYSNLSILQVRPGQATNTPRNTRTQFVKIGYKNRILKTWEWFVLPLSCFPRLSSYEEGHEVNGLTWTELSYSTAKGWFENTPGLPIEFSSQKKRLLRLQNTASLEEIMN